MKAKLYPAIGITLIGFFVIAGWLFLQRFQIEISTATPESEAVPVLKAPPKLEVTGQPTAVPSPVELPKLNPAMAAARQGLLRVSNRSEHALRVALLLKSPKATSPKTAGTPYEDPAHWDFAPGEGSQQGLVVALPNRRIAIKKGDVLVAFAQDGSQKYWGPYVVGETATPVWNQATAEWQLILTE
jgi:hypothetical protein